MVENANSTTAMVSTHGNQEKADSNAEEVSCTPALGSTDGSQVPVIMITNAVMVHTTTVSMNGSYSATKPSVTGRLVCTAECAIAADPTIFSLFA